MTVTSEQYAPPMADNEPQQWLTRAQAAARLGVTAQTVDNWARDGKLTRYKLAGKRLTRYKVEDVDALYRATTGES